MFDIDRRNGIKVGDVVTSDVGDGVDAYYKREDNGKKVWMNAEQLEVVDSAACGVLFRLSSVWIGVHYSPYNKRYCINLIPCVTLWITKPGGIRP